MTDQLQQLKAALADRYAVEKELGSGGMAIVYLAQDLKHNRQVAIKVLRPDVSAAVSSERFLREIEIAAGLSHPHILPVYDSGESDGVLFYVMPLVEGESLRDQLNRERQLPIDEALRIAREVANALQHAHERGVIHRDIKPENVLLSGGHAVIADFGISRAVGSAGGERLTGTGMALGTPAYMSPEQATGEDIDARADVYALGALVHEMLAGQPPFTGPSAESIMHQHLAVQPPSISGIRPTVDPAIARAVQRALAKTPADRFSSAAEFARALGGMTTGTQPVTALVRNMLTRRMLQTLGLYVIVGTLVVFLLDFLVNRMVLSPHLTTLGLVTLATLVPTVVLVGFKRSQPIGSWSTVSKLAIPANLAASVGILFFMFGAKDLGAATTTVTVETEAGESIERVVPKSEFRKRIALFAFENATGDPSQSWIEYGVPVGMAYDLRQDLFIDVRSLTLFKNEFQRVGYPSGTGLPLSLRRQLAEDEHLEYMVSGSVTNDGTGPTLTTSLHDTRRGRLLAERIFTGGDLFALMDDATLQIKRDLDVPESYLDEAEDLPVAEILTVSEEAYRHYIQGVRHIVVDDDWERSAGAMDRAVNIDPTFATAHAELYTVAILGNQSDRAVQALLAAMEHLYKLSERDQFGVKMAYYTAVERDPDAVLAIAKMRVELSPEDIEGHLVLANLYFARNDREGAIAELQRVLELDPSQYEYLQRLGDLFQLTGDFEEALRYFEQYAEQFPDDPAAFRKMGSLFRRLGDAEGARANFERARLLDPDDLAAPLQLARLDLDQGNFESGLRQIEAVEQRASVPQDRAAVYGAYQTYYTRRGQLNRAIEYQELGLDEQAQFQPPALALLARLEALGLYAHAGRATEAMERAAAIGAQLSAPFDQFLPIGYLEIYVAMQEPDSAERTLEEVEQLIRAFAIEVLRGDVLHAQGRIHEMRGQHEAAIQRYSSEMALDQTAIGINTDIARAYRELGQLNNAEAHLQESLAVYPAGGRALLELALVQAERGQTDVARATLNRVLEIWSEADSAYRPAQQARALKESLAGRR